MTATIESVTSTAENALMVYFSGNAFISLFAAQFLQYLWGMINALQVIVFTALFNINVPENAMTLMTAILQLAALDFIEIDQVLTFLEFRETEPFFQQSYDNGEQYSKFEDAGYESSVFFLNLGAIILVILIFIAYVIVKKIFQLLFSICKGCTKNCIGRALTSKIDYSVVILRFLLESCLELGLSALITTLMYDSSNYDSFWEAVSTSCAFLSLLALAIAPFYYLWIIMKYLRETRNEHTR